MNTSAKVFLGVLAGAAAGVTVGILYAPDKGSNTRKKIVQGANDKAGELADKFNGYVDRMSQQLEAAKAEVVGMVEEGKDEATNLLDKSKSTANGLADKSNSNHQNTDRKLAGSYK